MRWPLGLEDSQGRGRPAPARGQSDGQCLTRGLSRHGASRSCHNPEALTPPPPIFITSGLLPGGAGHLSLRRKVFHGVTRHRAACLWCYYVLWKEHSVLETGPCGLGVQLLGACGDGVREAGAMTPRAARPGARQCRGCHCCSAALLKSWGTGGARFQAAERRAPSARSSLPRRGSRPSPQSAPYAQPGGPSSTPTRRPTPAPGFQNHSALDRQGLQPLRSRKASAQRSLSVVDQSASLDPYIPPSEDRFCRLLP